VAKKEGKKKGEHALSARQVKALEILANPDNHKLTAGEIADKVGIAKSTLEKWKVKPHFQAELEKRINKHSFKMLPYAWKCLEDRMAKDTQALKLYFSLRGELKEQIEHSGPGGGSIQFSWLRSASDKELKELEEELNE